VTTIGLVIHSIADGLALGASLYLSEAGGAKGLGIVIFIAILMHKSPTAIGFGTFLAHKGREGWGLIKHVLAFTATSPLAAMTVYFSLIIAN